MTTPNLASSEGRALAVILTILGETGRGIVRGALLKCAEEPEAKHALDVMNTMERGFDELQRARTK